MGIPPNPESVYKNKGWAGWSDFLTKGESHRCKTYMPYEECVKLVRVVGIRSRNEFTAFTQSGQSQIGSLLFHTLW